MKKLFVIIVALFVGLANADNVITSKEYVDTQGATLQPEISAKNANTVLTYPVAGTDTPGEKAIYDASAAYGTQTDALVTAGQFNNALQTALDTEFVCVSRNDQGCLLYEIRAARPHPDQLPNGYTRLEYLEATGEQYIDTGVVGKSGISVEATVLATSLESNNCFIGNRDSGTTRFFPIFTISHRWDIAVNEDYVEGTVATNTKYHIRFISSNTGVTFFTNGTLTGNHSATNNSNTTNMYMFAVNYGNAQVQYQTHGRIYDMKIHYNNTPVRNFVPAKRNSDSKLGMYDLVSGTFFTNAGTGEFISGPVVSSNLYLPSGN